MIASIVRQLGKIAVTSMKLGREMARARALETVDALKHSQAAHWLDTTLARLGLEQRTALPAPRARKPAPRQPQVPATALSRKGSGSDRHGARGPLPH